MTQRLTLYYREGCHLCEDFLAHLQPLLTGVDCQLQLIDVDTDPRLIQEYGLKVPVLAGAAGEICHYEVNPVAVHTYLSRGQNPVECQPR